MTVRKQSLLRVADVVRVIQEEVRNAGGQAFLARRVGVNRPNLNSTLSGRRPPTGDILRAFNLQKVFAYEREGRTRDQEPLRMEGVVRLLRDEVERADSQAEWARQNGVHVGSLNSTINGKEPPTKDILRALSLRKVFAYEKLS
jgi:plasmid maintenance system antidote protein VapI